MLQNLGQKPRKWPLTVNFSLGTHTVLGLSPVRLILVAKSLFLLLFSGDLN